MLNRRFFIVGATAATAVGPQLFQASAETKPVATSSLHFYMADAETHYKPFTGHTITAMRSLDASRFELCTNNVECLGAGMYSINLEANELDAEIVALRFIAPGADPVDLCLCSYESEIASSSCAKISCPTKHLLKLP